MTAATTVATPTMLAAPRRRQTPRYKAARPRKTLAAVDTAATAAPAPSGPRPDDTARQTAALADLAASMHRQAQAGRAPDLTAVYGGLTPLIQSARNYAPFLPLFFRYNEKTPYSLANYMPFAVLYDRDIPPERIVIAGRQLGKTENEAHSMLLNGIAIPGFTQMYVVPLYEQTKRFSLQVVGRSLRQSWIRKQIFNPATCENNVLRKSLLNGSVFIFTYCYTSVDRARGNAVDCLYLDELQDLDASFIPVLAECMGGSKLWRYRTYCGTAKTTDNTSEMYFRRSSQAQWCIPCPSCRHENLATVEEDLMGMIGPRGLMCARPKCGHALNTRKGFWRHKFSDRIQSFPGWHVPQPIMPQYCENPRAWRELLVKMARYKKALFLNECLGEACDAGTRLITPDQIRAASVLGHRNRLDEALRRARAQASNYIGLAIGVDWGGRGEQEDSFTAFAVVALRRDWRAEVLFATRAAPTLDDTDEVAYACMLLNKFGAECIGHDFRGAGVGKDTMLVERGLAARLMPWVNESTMSRYFAKTRRSPTGRTYISINRGGAVQLLAHEVNSGHVLLPRYEEDSLQNAFLDLNSWFENYIARPDGTNLFQVLKSASQPDDIGWAIIYGLFSLYRRKQHWPAYMNSLTEQGIITKVEARDTEAGHD